jgi:hypothetical protein
MSEIGDQIAVPIAEQATEPSLRNHLLQMCSGGVAVLAAFTLGGSKPVPQHDANPLRATAPQAHTIAETSSLDLVDDIHASDAVVVQAGSPDMSSLTPDTPIPSSLNPARLNIPRAVKNYMRYNTLFLPFNDSWCSAAAIRDRKQQIIGIMTAEHCELNTADASGIYGSNGQEYESWTAPIHVYRGENLERLKTIAEIDEFIVPDQEHTPYQDVALGVAKGSTTGQVLKAYEASRLSDTAVHNLKPGTTIYMSGYPGYQPVNWTDNIQRQTFAMTALGPATIRTTGVQQNNASGMPKRLHVLNAVVPTDEQGAVCSYGASGSEGFIMRDGQVRDIGILSGFENLTDNKIPDGMWMGLSKYLPYDRSSTPTAECSFSYQLGLANDVQIKTTESDNTIPGYNEAQRLIDPDRIAAELQSPNYTKTYLDGVVALDIGTSIEWINNPIIFYDSKIKRVAFVYAKQHGEEDDQNFHYIASYEDVLSGAFVYPHGSSDIVSLKGVTEALNFQADSSGNMHSSFVTSTQQRFGMSLKHAPDVVGGDLQLTFVNNQLTIVPRNDPLGFGPGSVSVP